MTGISEHDTSGDLTHAVPFWTLFDAARLDNCEARKMYAFEGRNGAGREFMGIATSVVSLAQGRLGVAAPYLIEQDWPAYTPEQHAVWAELVSRRMPQLREHACQEYLDGFEQIGLQEDKLPDLKSVSARLAPRTGWQSTPVSGFLPPDAFFEMLAARMFPTTTWLRGRDSLEYTPEPDIFHDVFGHVPMHAHPVFGDFLERYGKICARLTDAEDLERMGRLFWFTVEFGLIRQNGEVKVYGSGLISSHGECTRVLAGGCEVKDFDLGAVLNQEFDTGAMQPVLYAVESFDQVYEATKRAEELLG
jgi:phenylalanine-4-hydroxylase